MFSLLSTEGSLVNKRDLLAVYLSGTYCHKTSTRPPSCATPQQPTIYLSGWVFLSTPFLPSFSDWKKINRFKLYLGSFVWYKTIGAHSIKLLYLQHKLVMHDKEWPFPPNHTHPTPQPPTEFYWMHVLCKCCSKFKESYFKTQICFYHSILALFVAHSD